MATYLIEIAAHKKVWTVTGQKTPVFSMWPALSQPTLILKKNVESKMLLFSKIMSILFQASTIAEIMLLAGVLYKGVFCPVTGVGLVD